MEVDYKAGPWTIYKDGSAFRESPIGLIFIGRGSQSLYEVRRQGGEPLIRFADSGLAQTYGWFDQAMRAADRAIAQEVGRLEFAGRAADRAREAEVARIDRAGYPGPLAGPPTDEEIREVLTSWAGLVDRDRATDDTIRYLRALFTRSAPSKRLDRAEEEPTLEERGKMIYELRTRMLCGADINVGAFAEQYFMLAIAALDQAERHLAIAARHHRKERTTITHRPQPLSGREPSRKK